MNRKDIVFIPSQEGILHEFAFGVLHITALISVPAIDRHRTIFGKQE